MQHPASNFNGQPDGVAFGAANCVCPGGCDLRNCFRQCFQRGSDLIVKTFLRGDFACKTSLIPCFFGSQFRRHA